MKTVPSFLIFLNTEICIGIYGTQGVNFLCVVRYCTKEFYFINICEKQFSNKVTVHFNFFGLGYPT